METETLEGLLAQTTGAQTTGKTNALSLSEPYRLAGKGNHRPQSMSSRFRPKERQR